MNDRDYNDPKYKKWRLAVRKRDHFKCVLCGSRKRLQSHHIKRWIDFPALRYVISNGVTLCKHCHDNKVKDHEDMYAPQFSQMTGRDKDAMKIMFWMKKGYV